MPLMPAPDEPLTFRLSEPGLPAALLHTPRGFEPNYRYPLLTMLHDDGRTERQGDSLWRRLSDRNYLGLSVRGPQASGAGFSWALGAVDAADAARRVAELFPVHRRRVFAVGVGAGAAAALRLAAARPDVFAGAVALQPRGAAGRLSGTTRRRVAAPCFVAHSRAGADADDAREWSDLLRNAGHQVQQWAFAGAAAAPTAGMLRAANRWLLDHALRPASQESNANAPRA